MDENPYASPETEGNFANWQGEGNRVLRSASHWTRFVNLLLDCFLFYVCFIGAMALVLTAFSMSSIFPNRPRQFDAEMIFDQWAPFVAALVYLIFFAAGEYLWGRSPAKYLTRTRAVQRNGNRLTLGQAIFRAAARLIPIDPFSIFFSRDRICLHDWLSGTRVVLDD